MRVALYRRGHFNAAHRLYVPTWSDEKNQEIFGKCNNPNYHGHNYDLEVKVSGEVDPETGMLIDLKYLRDIIEEKVEEKLDHKNLNTDIPELRDIRPTTENICYFIYQQIKEELGEKYDVKVRLWETPRNSAEYPAD